MEKHGWVTDDQTYASRPSALGVARRLKAAVEKHEGVPAEHMTWRIWLTPQGWRWQLGLKEKVAGAGSA